jgi:hypothetical protein
MGLSCDPYKNKGWHNCITIRNNTNKEIYYSDTWGNTLFIHEYNPSLDKSGQYIFSNSSNRFCNNSPRDYYELGFNSYKILNVYIFDATAVEQYWDSVRANRLILHHYKLTLEDLNRMSWEIIYPPDGQ